MKHFRFLGLLLLFVSIYPLLLLITEAQKTDNEEIARQVMEDIWNGNNPDVANDLYAVSFTWYWPDSTTIATAPGVWQLFYIEPLRKAVPDIEFVVEHIMTAEDIVSVHFTATGTFTEPYQFFSTANPFTGLHSTIEPTGEEIVWDGVFIYQFEDGKIVEEKWYYDAGIVATLGGIEFVIIGD